MNTWTEQPTLFGQGISVTVRAPDMTAAGREENERPIRRRALMFMVGAGVEIGPGHFLSDGTRSPQCAPRKTAGHRHR